MRVWTVLFLATVPAIFAGSAWATRQRRPDRPHDGMVHTEDHGRRASTVVRGLDNHVAARVLLAMITATVVSAGIEAWPSSRGGAVVLFVIAGYTAVAFWLFQSGRFGDGSVWITADGIHQTSLGFEQGVRWPDIESLFPMPTGAGLEATGKVVSRRRAPLIWAGNGPKHRTDAMSLQLGNIHPALQIPLMQAIQVWAEDESARREIGTASAVQRLHETA